MKHDALTMAWNEPGSGKSNQNQNPWNRGGKDQGPPDLDQIIKKFLDKLKESLKGGNKSRGVGSGSSGGTGGTGGTGGFGGSKSTSSSGSGSSGMGFSGNGFGKSFLTNTQEWGHLATIAVIVLGFLYLISGIYIVEPPERAVIMRFGKYLNTKGPGPHWLPTFIDSKEIVNVEQVLTSDHSGLMLTKDRNIASVGVAVQYRIGEELQDVRAFLFDVVNPVHSLQESAESALRQVVGQSTMDEVLTLKRSEIALAIKDQLIETLKPYHTGIQVLDVAMQFAKAPDEVRSAFDDVIKAAADEERLVNQARAYENEVLPKARSTVARLNNEALGYKDEITFHAEGNVQRFNQILPEYKKAPKVTQTRLYLDTMEDLLKKTTKVILESGGNNNNLLYLPLDKLIHNALPTENASSSGMSSGTSSGASSGTTSGMSSGMTSGTSSVSTSTGNASSASASSSGFSNSSNSSNSSNTSNSSNSFNSKEKNA